MLKRYALHFQIMGIFFFFISNTLFTTKGIFGFIREWTLFWWNFCLFWKRRKAHIYWVGIGRTEGNQSKRQCDGMYYSGGGRWILCAMGPSHVGDRCINDIALMDQGHCLVGLILQDPVREFTNDPHAGSQMPFVSANSVTNCPTHVRPALNIKIADLHCSLHRCINNLFNVDSIFYNATSRVFF